MVEMQSARLKRAGIARCLLEARDFSHVRLHLDDAQYKELMRVAHLPENLLSYEETLGASETINKWVDEGHEVFVITGRPFDSYEPSRAWLDKHNLERISLFCVDKYGREKVTNASAIIH